MYDLQHAQDQIAKRSGRGRAELLPHLLASRGSVAAGPDVRYDRVIMGLVAAVLLAQVAFTALASRDPVECPAVRGPVANLWERAKSPEALTYCDLIASASSKLAGTRKMANAALQAAVAADALVPGRAAPQALMGRAQASLGHWDEALKALREAAERASGALEDAPTLLAWARALARTGHPDESRSAYRALLPRASMLSSSDRIAAEIEAGLIAMEGGRSGLDEAVGTFREAMREASDEAASVAALGLALGLDRQGFPDEARAVLSRRLAGDPRGLVAGGREGEWIAVAPGARCSLVAMGLELREPKAARDMWRECSAVSGPWAEYARSKATAVSGPRYGVKR